MKTIRHLFLLLALLLGHSGMLSKNYTVIISLDGYRWDYPQWYDTPFIDFMASQGVASGLIPSFPSKTFPNHYTLATGLYPDHHGIVANEFLDPANGRSFSLGTAEQKMNPDFYGGEPIWNTAHRQGKRVAVFYWPGSDVKVNGRYPDKYFLYDQEPRLTLSQRIQGVLQQLQLPAQQRPDLIMAYMEQPDAHGHTYGPQGKRTRHAVQIVDSLLQSLYDGIHLLPDASHVNLIVVSDHGMAWVARDHTIGIRQRLRPEWVRMASGSVPCNIYVQPGCQDSVFQALQGLDHAKVWRRQNIPSYLHYGTSRRVGDVVVCPDLGYVVYDDSITPGGNHGYDPTLQDMHALFRAIGPDFRHTEIPHFRNVDVYPLLCRLLGIIPAPNDGRIDEIETILYKNK